MHNHSASLDVDGDRPEHSIDCQNPFSLSLSVPGKVILFGEHSVVYGKLAIAASLGLRTKFSFREYKPNEIGNNKVYINLKSINLMLYYYFDVRSTNCTEKINPSLSKNVTLDEPETANHEQFRTIIDDFIKKNNTSTPLSQVQYNALYSLFYLLIVMVGSSNIDIKPFHFDVETDVTISAGLGSSASLMVGISAVFFRYIQYKILKKDNKEDTVKDISKKDLDLISRWAFSAEKIIHGTPSGLDNTICTFGSVVEYRKNSSMKLMEMHHKLKVLLINSNVPKDTKALVAKVAALKQKYPTVVDNILVAMDNISNTAAQELVKLDETYSSKKLATDERDCEVGKIYNRLEDLVDFNQNLLRSLQVSHPSLETICGILADGGLHGKLTGAGGGGYAFAIVPPNFNKNISNIIEVLNSHGFDAKLTDLGGPGLTFT
ncbi:mevalonate kinase [Holotrichia oblita]|uniref:Mevalonate kinase n=2 Tax=Holotrichia oblita TaxID=644536 RepID=A0ACB9SGS0_HOLOL|nr:mevalonate kinase [Holotrichia oblita]KAI4454392.1 mevalonate kinase [Holotrichia oblita]